MLGKLGLRLRIGRTLPYRHLLILNILIALLCKLDAVEEALRATLGLRTCESRVHAGCLLLLHSSSYCRAHHFMMVVWRDSRLVHVALLGSRFDPHLIRALFCYVNYFDIL